MVFQRRPGVKGDRTRSATYVLVRRRVLREGLAKCCCSSGLRGVRVASCLEV
jgi:hypothetical protein